jgi:hypothetical protein
VSRVTCHLPLFLTVLLLLTGGCVHPSRSPQPGAKDGLTPVTLRSVAGLPPLAICENGSAQTAIVPAPGKAYYREIAEFLADHLHQATGAKFVVTNTPPATGDAICVGPVETPATEKILARARKLPAEHFLIERFGGGVILVGNDAARSVDRGKELSIHNLSYADGMLFCSRGTWFAAIDFLERFVGIRWFMPGPLGLCVPDLRTSGLSFPAVAYTDGPVFAHRFPGGASDLPEPKDAGPNKPHRHSWWLWANYLSRMGTMYPAIPNHTDCDWHKFYAQEHPEYFALRADGTRMIGGEGREMYSSQRCYSDEGGFQQHLRNIERYLATGEGVELFTDRVECLPNEQFIYWLPNDGFAGCECPACLALIDKDAPSDRTHSRLVWSYAAKLGRAIKAKWPNKKLCVLAYSTFAVVPPELDLPDNILATLCLSDVPDNYMKEPAYRQANQARLDALQRKLKNKVGLWIYYPACPHYENKMSIPLFAPHVQVEFLRANRGQVFGEMMNNMTLEVLQMNAPALYLYHKQLWNPDLDVDALVADYITRLYGPAAPAMRRWYDLTIARWENTRWSRLPPPYALSLAVPESLIWNETYPQDVRDQLQQTLNDALAAAPAGSLYRERIQYLLEAARSFFEAGTRASSAIKVDKTIPWGPNDAYPGEIQVIRDKSQAHSGEHYLRVQMPAAPADPEWGTGVVSARLFERGGEHYRFQIYCRGTARVRVTLSAWGSTHWLCTVPDQTDLPVSDRDHWTRYEGTIRVPEQLPAASTGKPERVAKLQLILYVRGAADLDDVILTEIASIKVPADGPPVR